MPEPAENRDEWHAILEALRRLQQRQDEMERRLERLEARQAGHAPGPKTAQPRPAAVPRAPETGPAAAGRRPWEARMGLTWINRAGVITLVLGVAFFFKYAADLGWIGEGMRVAIGCGGGLLLIALADRWWRHGQEIFAQGLSGAGIGILYLSLYASFGFYHLLPQAAAFVLMTLNTAAAGALALRYRAPAMAVLGLLGGYLTPAVLSTGVDRPWVLFSYVLLLDAGAVAIARIRNWRGLEALAFLATAGLYFSWLASFLKPDKHFVAYLFALVYYALFASRNIRGVFAAAHLVVILELLLVSLPEPLPFLPLALAVCAAGLGIASRRAWPEAPLAVFASFWIPYSVAYLAFKAHDERGASLAFLSAILACFLVLTRRPARHLDLVVVALNVTAYFAAAYDLMEPQHHAYTGLFALVLAGAHAALGFERRSRAPDDPAGPLYFGIALALATLAAPLQLTGFRVTLAWALEVAALAWIGRRTGEARLWYAGLTVGALVLLRLGFLDASIYPSPHLYVALGNLRFLTFTVAAAGFWLAAWWMRPGRTALLPYVAGHAVMLWALILEVLGWAARTAAPQNLESFRSAAVSILMAAYAVLLVGLGVATRLAVNRVLGLALIAAVVVKLYFYDVWQIGRMYRVAAFAALGVFLLVTSYLYSRYRGSIEGRGK